MLKFNWKIEFGSREYTIIITKHFSMFFKQIDLNLHLPLAKSLIINYLKIIN